MFLHFRDLLSLWCPHHLWACSQSICQHLSSLTQSTNLASYWQPGCMAEGRGGGGEDGVAVRASTSHQTGLASNPEGTLKLISCELCLVGGSCPCFLMFSSRYNVPQFSLIKKLIHNRRCGTMLPIIYATTN